MVISTAGWRHRRRRAFALTYPWAARQLMDGLRHRYLLLPSNRPKVALSRSVIFEAMPTDGFHGPEPCLHVNLHQIHQEYNEPAVTPSGRLDVLILAIRNPWPCSWIGCPQSPSLRFCVQTTCGFRTRSGSNFRCLTRARPATDQSPIYWSATASIIPPALQRSPHALPD
jgi:hypothetical protein